MDILYQEELLWRTKSRLGRMKEEERITSFFS